MFSLQVIILLLFARAWSRVLDLLLPLGFLLLLLSILPHYFTFTNLARLLDGDVEVNLKVWSNVLINYVACMLPPEVTSCRPQTYDCAVLC